MANFSVDLSPLFKVYDWWTGIQKQKQADAALADVAKLAQQGDVVTQQKTDAQPAWTPQAPTEDFLSASLMQQQPQIPQVPTPQQYNVTETRTPYQQTPEYKAALWKLAPHFPKIAEKLIMPEHDAKPIDMGGNVGLLDAQGNLIKSYPKTPEPLKPQAPETPLQTAQREKYIAETDKLKNPTPEEPYKVGFIKDFPVKGVEIPHEYMGNGQWKPRPDLGSKPVYKPTTTINMGNPYDKALVTKIIAELPKLKREASTQKFNIERINMALSLIERGVTGRGGQLKAFLAGFGEPLGIGSENMTESDAFQKLTRLIVGPMRLEIIGAGQVSNYEQELMKSISGGGGTSKGAAKTLLNYYKKAAQEKIDNYNETVEGVSQFNPNVTKIYKTIKSDKNETASVKELAPGITEGWK